MPVRGSDHAQSPSIRRHNPLFLQTGCREKVPETQQMLTTVPGTTSQPMEIIPSRKINEACEHVLMQDLDYRFVIDMNTARLRSRQLSGASL